MLVVLTFQIPKTEWWTQNSRGGWQAKYRRTNPVKHRAYITARNQLRGVPRPSHWPVRVIARISPLTHGRFDPENAAPMVKAILDAITLTGWWPDDNSRYVTGPDYRPGPTSGNGYIITIIIQEAEGNIMTEQERTDAIIMLSSLSQQSYQAITTAKKMDAEQLVKDVHGIIDDAQKIITMIETAD